MLYREIRVIWFCRGYYLKQGTTFYVQKSGFLYMKAGGIYRNQEALKV